MNNQKEYNTATPNNLQSLSSSTSKTSTVPLAGAVYLKIVKFVMRLMKTVTIKHF